MRAAATTDTVAIAEIYNAGIATREATFETRPRTARDIDGWLGKERLPLLVADLDGEVVGWARVSRYSERDAYAGVGECSVYVSAAHRGRGIGGALLHALLDAAVARGYWKLLGKLFPGNEASARLVKSAGFRDVGLHLRHAKLDGEWLDVLLVERLLLDDA
ncbi:MAG: arsinothricin resistance N-acetyltransferase ArsN1 family A [Thermoleophilaceae bacterium]